MSKNFLVLIVLSLYIGNSNCAAANDDAQNKLHLSRVSAFEMTDSPHLIVKILNLVLDDLRASQIEKGQKEAKLEEYQKMIVKKAEALDKSKADLNKLLITLSSALTPDCLDHDMTIMYIPQFNKTAWSNNREIALLMQMFNSIGSQTYKGGTPQVKLDDLVWRI